jgi:hypothetical protein
MAKIVKQISMKDSDFADISEEILNRGDLIRFKAHGSSMIPLIRDGDLLTIEPLEPDDIKQGMVIFYRTAGEKCVAHRVTRVDIRNGQRTLITRGDASPRSEEEVSEVKMLGQVIRIHRCDHRIDLNHNLWWILSRHLPGFLHFIYSLQRVKRKLHHYL